jgi:hypothetical protein
MSRNQSKPFLISESEDGTFRLTVRDTRYNSQGFPIVTGTLQDEIFPTATAAKAFARQTFGARGGEYETK